MGAIVQLALSKSTEKLPHGHHHDLRHLISRVERALSLLEKLVLVVLIPGPLFPDVVTVVEELTMVVTVVITSISPHFRGGVGKRYN